MLYTPSMNLYMNVYVNPSIYPSSSTGAAGRNGLSVAHTEEQSTNLDKRVLQGLSESCDGV